MTIIHSSPLPDVVIPDGTITDLVFAMADELSDKPAMIDGPSGKVWTFGELFDSVKRLAGGLSERGFGPGSTIAIIAPNMPEYAVAFHGAARAGATVTTVNPTYTPDEIRHQLVNSGASMIFTIPEAVGLASAAMADTSVNEIVVFGEADGATSLESLYGDPIDQVAVDPAEHVAVLPYSSGTTGLAKGVMLTHRNLVANIAQLEHVMAYEVGEVALAALPFFHIYGMQVLMNGLLAKGVTVVSVPRFDLVQALTLIEEHQISQLFVVPPMVLALAKHPIIDEHDLSSLKLVFSGAAPLGAELAREATERVGCEVVQGYGMTELSPVSHATRPGGFRPGSSGVTVSNTECRVVDEEGVDQPVDGVGELWVRGPQVMKGYLNNAEATEQTIDEDGWLHTGDVAKIDADGHCYIVDRVKELIKYKGFQVPPAELEALLLTHPGVADVAVIGIADQEAGELPKAFVVLRPDASVSAEEIQAFVKGKVASYKQIRIVEFTDEIPKSASGKILRRLLRDGS